MYYVHNVIFRHNDICSYYNISNFKILFNLINIFHFRHQNSCCPTFVQRSTCNYSNYYFVLLNVFTYQK